MPKVGLDFFPLDTVLDDKFGLIEAEFGLKGFAVIIKLMQKIYCEQGYYCEWTNEIGLLFANKIYAGYDLVSQIVNAAIRRGIFSAELYEKYGVLTSAGIQKRYFDATSRRVHVEAKDEYLLISHTLIPKNVNILSGNVNRNTKNVYRNSQSKERKESKDSKVFIKKKYGEMQNVLLTDEEFEKIKEKFPEDYQNRIDTLSLGIVSHGYKYRSHYAALLQWARNEDKKKTVQIQKKKSYFHNFEQRDIDFQEIEDEYFEGMMIDTLN